MFLFSFVPFRPQIHNNINAFKKYKFTSVQDAELGIYFPTHQGGVHEQTKHWFLQKMADTLFFSSRSLPVLLPGNLFLLDWWPARFFFTRAIFFQNEKKAGSVKGTIDLEEFKDAKLTSESGAWELHNKGQLIKVLFKHWHHCTTTCVGQQTTNKQTNKQTNKPVNNLARHNTHDSTHNSYNNLPFT